MLERFFFGLATKFPPLVWIPAILVMLLLPIMAFHVDIPGLFGFTSKSTVVIAQQQKQITTLIAAVKNTEAEMTVVKDVSAITAASVTSTVTNTKNIAVAIAKNNLQHEKAIVTARMVSDKTESDKAVAIADIDEILDNHRLIFNTTAAI